MSQSPDQAVSPYDAMGLLSSDPYHQPDQAAGPCQAPDHAASPTPPPATLDPYGVPATHPAHSALAANDHYMVDPMVDPYGCAPLTPPVSPAAKAASPLQAAALDPHGGAPFTPPVPTTAEMLNPYGVVLANPFTGSRCQYRDIRLRNAAPQVPLILFDSRGQYREIRLRNAAPPSRGQSAWQPAAPQVAQSRTRHPRPLILFESDSDDTTIRFRTPSPPYSTPDSTDPEPIAPLETRPNPRLALAPPGKRARLFNQPLPRPSSSAGTSSRSDAARAGTVQEDSQIALPPLPVVDSPRPVSTDSLPRTIRQRSPESISSTSSEGREPRTWYPFLCGRGDPTYWLGEPWAEPVPEPEPEADAAQEDETREL